MPDLNVKPTDLSDYEASKRTLAWYEEQLARVEKERDQAREECGHEKAMRRFLRDELDRWIRRYMDLERSVPNIRTESE